MTTSDERKLSPKVQHFISEYIKDFNGKQAAIRAGYSAKTAESQASRLLRNAKVAAAIAAIQEQLKAKSGVTAERIIEELARIGFADLRKAFGPDGRLLPATELPDEIVRAIAGIEVTSTPGKKGATETVTKIRFWEKPKALHTMAHILGMLKDKVEHSGPDGKPIRVSFGGRYRPADGAPAHRRR